MNSLLPWFILLLPLVSATVITLVTRSSRGVSGYISVVAALVGFYLQLHRLRQARYQRSGADLDRPVADISLCRSVSFSTI